MKYTEQFEKFWKLYPGRTNGFGRIIKQDKSGAFLEWCKMNTDERKLAMSVRPEQGKYTPDARKWLKHKRWEDEDVTDQNKGRIAKLKLEKEKEKMRKEYTSWIMEKTPEYLLDFLEQYPNYKWLIKELKPEIFI